MLAVPLRERPRGQAPVLAVHVAVCVWGAAKPAGPHPGDSRLPHAPYPAGEGENKATSSSPRHPA